MTERDEYFLRQSIPDENDLAAALVRLQNGEPLAHILGEWDFYDLTFAISNQCLIPRPDTEHLVEYLIKHLPQNAHFWDLCCGSGCIAITVLAHRPDTTATAVDLSQGALDMTAQNAKKHGVTDRLTVQKGDVLAGQSFGKTPDAIVCNPPYIATDVVETLDSSVKDYEPRMALDGGHDGLDFYRVLLNTYAHKTPLTVLEIGYDQGQALRDMAADLTPNHTFSLHQDYAKNDRMVVLQK